MGDIASQIRHAFEALSINSSNQIQRLSELLEESPAMFRQVVGVLLGSARETPELRHVIGLLSGRAMLAPMLRDLSRTDRGAAAVVAQLAQRMDPRFDRSMARPVSETKSPVEQAGPDPEFLLGLLDALSGALALMPMLEPLRQSNDPKVRARMALLLGRITRAQNWCEALETDEDPRVRANVMESHWSAGGQTVPECYTHGLEDSHHRVVANALVGLYLQGDTSAVSGMVNMAQHHDGVFRAAAAWAMGRTGDTRFLQILRLMRRGEDQDSLVARGAPQAISRINQATFAATRRETQLTCLRRESSQDSTFDATFTACDKEPGPLPILKPTDWQLRANLQPVWCYQAHFVPAAATLALGLVLPGDPAEDREQPTQWTAALRAAANWRRPHDRFVASLYPESADWRSQMGTPKIVSDVRKAPTLGFRTDPAMVLPSAYHSAHPVDGLSHLSTVLEQAADDLHLILVLDAIPDSLCDLEGCRGLLSTLRQRNIRLHCLVTSRATDTLAAAFQQLSFDTGGFQLLCPERADLSAALPALIASTFGHYRLQCPLPEPVDQIEVELQAEGHQGKLTVPVDLSRSPRMAA